MTDAAALERVYEAFQDFHDYFASAFGRKQWREHSGQYLQGLLVQSQERRNAEKLSETAAASSRVLQRFLTEARWDDDAVVDRLQSASGGWHQGWGIPRGCGCWTARIVDQITFPSRG